MSDQEFMSHILGEICDYAIQNEMEPDETIGTISRNFLALLTISTFNGWERKSKTNADRIRSMTDGELAEFLTSEHFVDVLWCSRWLKSSVEADNGED